MTIEVTVFCEGAAQAAILDKMRARAATFRVHHPMARMDRSQMEQMFWNNIEQGIAQHCNERPTIPILEMGFVFGAPLDDTVFMAVGSRLQPDRPHHSFLLRHGPIDGSELMIAFYTLVTGAGS